MEFTLNSLENIMGKEENAGHQHFFSFPTMFSKDLLLWSLKLGIVWQSVEQVFVKDNATMNLIWYFGNHVP